ncbi:MAG: carbon-monoxide dehydrogenase medium subunit [Verrucomicrobiales bacterium]|jgi:carbon-monoxide dehydrogenase medium subunit
MTVVPAVGLVRSGSLDEVLRSIDEDAVPYAGATELIPAMRLGVRRPESLVDLKRLPELQGVTVDEGARTVRIGAATTHREVAESDAVKLHLPTLAGAASRVGNVRVRTSGTLGGNLCFAEPRSDLSVVLTALGAHAEIASAADATTNDSDHTERGGRVVTISDFIVGAFESCLTPKELLVAVTTPFEPAGMAYWKLQSYERPTVGVATVPTIDGWLIVVGAATERPEHATIQRGDVAALDEFLDGLDLSDDLSGSPQYKRLVLRNRLRPLIAGSR